MSLLAPCLGLGARELSGGQRSPLFEAARVATLDRVTRVVQQLPTTHHVFRPFLPAEPAAYWSQLSDLFGTGRAAVPVPALAAGPWFARRAGRAASAAALTSGKCSLASPSLRGGLAGAPSPGGAPVGRLCVCARVHGTVSPNIADCLSEVTGLCQTFVPPRRASVSGDTVLYRSLTTLARALAQYLLVLPKLPGHLHLPPEKERDTVKFVVSTLEVRGLGAWCPCAPETGEGSLTGAGGRAQSARPLPPPTTPARYRPVPALAFWAPAPRRHGYLAPSATGHAALPPEAPRAEGERPPRAGLGPDSGLEPCSLTRGGSHLSSNRLAGEGAGQRGGWAGEERVGSGRSHGVRGPSAGLRGLRSTAGSARRGWGPVSWSPAAFDLEHRPSICVSSQEKEAHGCGALPAFIAREALTGHVGLVSSGTVHLHFPP